MISLPKEQVYTLEQNVAKAHLLEFGINKFTVERLTQLYYALDHRASSYFYLADDVKLQIKKDIQKLVRIKKPVIAGIKAKATKINSSSKTIAEDKIAFDMSDYEVSQSLKIIILKLFPYKPWCCDEFVQNSPRSLETALKKRYIQYNPPGFLSFIVVDCDYADAKDAWRSANLPPPTWTTTNPQNLHAHLCWALTTPVWSGGSNQSPARLFKAVQEAYRVSVKGDGGFASLLTKNPVNKNWMLDSESDFKTYALAELMSFVKLEKKVKVKKKEVGQELGRNCMLFDEVRLFAYAQARNYELIEPFTDAVLEQTEKLNLNFADQLPFSEINRISKSISKFAFKNCRVHSEQFLKRQAARGRKGGEAKGLKNAEKRLQALEMNSLGISKQKIGRALMVSRDCVNRWVLTK